MAFSTIQGSGGAPDSFVGTSGVDSIVFEGNTSNFFLGAQQANDFIGFDNVGALQTGTVNLATLKGGEGADTFANLGGVQLVSSWINGNANADVMGSVAAGLSVITGTLQGGQGADIISIALGQGSIVNGNKDNDTIQVTNGSAVSAESLFGGQGNDTISLGVTAAVTFTGSIINGDDDNDLIQTQAAQAAGTFSGNTVFGGAGNDTINFGATAGLIIDDITVNGDDGNDVITTGLGLDTVNGGAGNDAITGGISNDSLTGGAGANEFIFTSTSPTDATQVTAGTAAKLAAGRVDTITDWKSGSDIISGFGSDGAGNFGEAAGTNATYAAALTAANVDFDATGNNYFATAFGSGTNFTLVLFINQDGGAGAADTDGAIILGSNFVSAASAINSIADTDIIA